MGEVSQFIFIGEADIGTCMFCDACRSTSNGRKSEVGEGGNCAVLSTGGVSCWGYNALGELGNGTTGGGTNFSAQSDVPVSVTGISNAVSVTSTGTGNCALWRRAMWTAGVTTHSASLGTELQVTGPTPLTQMYLCRLAG
jgi:hypothetical protein